MAENSTISWTKHTFNPVIGCSKVHEGCANCYAERDATRWHRAVWGLHGTRVMTSPDYWRQPLRWNRIAAKVGERHRVFCASMADVFEDWQGEIRSHDDDVVMRCQACDWLGTLPVIERQLAPGSLTVCGTCGLDLRKATMADIRSSLLRLIDRTPHLDWLLLTKRPENIREMWLPVIQDSENWFFDPAEQKARGLDNAGPHKSQLIIHNGDRKNVWIGTSISNQASADKFVPELLKCRDLVPVLFLSCEPLLGPIELRRIQHDGIIDSLTGGRGGHRPVQGQCSNHIDWVIAGGESGPHARPMHPADARSLRDDCLNADVPFHFKQWGEWLPYEPRETAPLWDGQDGSLFDANLFPVGLTEHKPVKGWYAPELDSVVYRHVGKKAAGRLLDGREWNEYPSVEVAAL